jgi:hypothetical protein
MPKYAKRRDSNDSEVTKGLPGSFRDLSLNVLDCSSSAGLLDRIVFLGDLPLFIEIKATELIGKPPSKVLTPREKKFPSGFFIVHSQQELLMVLKDQYKFAVMYSKARAQNRKLRNK